MANGVVQSVAPAAAEGGYWAAMLPDHRPRRALLLGFGGGTLTHLLAARYGTVPTVGVDDNPTVVTLARNAFGPLPPATQLVLADALRFVGGCAGAFDYVAVDLFRADLVPRGTFGLPFLRAVRTALMPGGHAVFNLFQDPRTASRIARLEAVFRIERAVRVGDNRVVHCRA
jgi:spermidine synthase